MLYNNLSQYNIQAHLGKKLNKQRKRKLFFKLEKHQKISLSALNILQIFS